MEEKYVKTVVTIGNKSYEGYVENNSILGREFHYFTRETVESILDNNGITYSFDETYSSFGVAFEDKYVGYSPYVIPIDGVGRTVYCIDAVLRELMMKRKE